MAAALPSMPDAEQFNLLDSGLGEGAAAELRAAKAAGSDVRLRLGDGEDSEDSQAWDSDSDYNPDRDNSHDCPWAPDPWE